VAPADESSLAAFLRSGKGKTRPREKTIKGEAAKAGAASGTTASQVSKKVGEEAAHEADHKAIEPTRDIKGHKEEDTAKEKEHTTSSSANPEPVSESKGNEDGDNAEEKVPPRSVNIET
jgi:hypothetical protein